MHPTLRNVLALVAGVLVGGMVNMGIVVAGDQLITAPEGLDLSQIHLYSPKHFIAPFLAHALGTLAGAFVAAKLAINIPMKLALGVGVFFLFGGIGAVYMIGGPLWFKALDLLVAYIPMGWLGGKIASGNAGYE